MPAFGEGIDLHRECSRVIHHDAHWNPAVIEQRTGRIDRIHSRTAREREHDASACLHVHFAYLPGTVDEQILLRAFERGSWYDALLGGTGKSVDGEIRRANSVDDVDSTEVEDALRRERRLPPDLAHRLAIDLAPKANDPEPAALSGPARTTAVWTDHPEDRRVTPLQASALLLLRALVHEGAHVEPAFDGRGVVIERPNASGTWCRVEAFLHRDAVELRGPGVQKRVALSPLDLDLRLSMTLEEISRAVS